jgi:RNA polymerase sigma-70 factor, ECF subfamily
VASARLLSNAFFQGAGGVVSVEGLEARLHAVVTRARAHWHTTPLAIQDEQFAEFLGRRVPISDLEQARIEDLYLAYACATGSKPALAIVEERYLPDVDGALRKMGLSQDRIDETKQGLRKLLFVGDETSPPRIGEYRGSGELRAWMRVTAMRAALKLIRKDAREGVSSSSADDAAILAARAQEDDPELAYMKAAYRVAFKSAFQEALDSLQPRERTLLKQQLVDGLGIDELGTLYEVHRATAARWLQAAREKLLVRTRRTFMLRARISSDECESIMRLVRSQLDVSLQRRLSND